jgi:hypothetical protein
MQCLGVKTTEEFKFPFGDGIHYFFGPQRCRNSARNGELCRSCNMRTRDCIQSSSRFDHGQCNKAVPPWSRLYGGILYRIESKKYGEPPIEILNKVQGMYNRIKSLEMSADYGCWKLRIVKEEEQQYPMSSFRGRNSGRSREPEPKEKKIINNTEKTPEHKILKEAKFVESAVDIEKKIIEDIEEIKVKPVIIDGTHLYRDMNNNKLYNLQFKYVGRWDTLQEKILKEISDSDTD